MHLQHILLFLQVVVPLSNEDLALVLDEFLQRLRNRCAAIERRRGEMKVQEQPELETWDR